MTLISIRERPGGSESSNAVLSFDGLGEYSGDRLVSISLLL